MLDMTHLNAETMNGPSHGDGDNVPNNDELRAGIIDAYEQITRCL